MKGFYRISGLMTGRSTFLRSVSYAEIPQKFLKALARLPECGGIALGMDRLVMLFFDAALIDEVMPFTVDRA